MRPRSAVVFAAALLAGGAVSTPATTTTERTNARIGPVSLTKQLVSTGGGTRPFHLIRFPPGQGVRVETVWLGGRPGRSGTVGAFVRANAGRGAIGGINGDFFLLARRVPSGNLLIHRGRSYLGNSERGAIVFGANGSADVVPGSVKAGRLLAQGVREATSGKPAYVLARRIGPLGTLTPDQRGPAYHRAAVGRFANGDTGLVVVGGAGLSARAFAQGLIKLGFVEALGMDLNSSANLNWRGTQVNRRGTQRSIPTGTIVFWRPPG